MPRASCRIGVQSSGKKVDPHLGFLVTPEGNGFSYGGQAEGCIIVLELPDWRACGPGVEDRSLRTQATLGFWARAWQVRSAELNRDLVHLKSGEDLTDAQVQFLSLMALFMKRWWNTRPWDFSHNGSFEMLQTIKILLQGD